jgi:hypothetical protein
MYYFVCIHLYVMQLFLHLEHFLRKMYTGINHKHDFRRMLHCVHCTCTRSAWQVDYNCGLASHWYIHVYRVRSLGIHSLGTYVHMPFHQVLESMETTRYHFWPLTENDIQGWSEPGMERTKL